MKNIKFLIKGVTNILHIQVTDILGKTHMIHESGDFYKYSDGTWTIDDAQFDVIKHYALKEGIRINDKLVVKVARIKLVKEEKNIEIAQTLRYEYYFFKPVVRYTDRITVELL